MFREQAESHTARREGLCIRFRRKNADALNGANLALNQIVKFPETLSDYGQQRLAVRGREL
jgi:hypothetical protein